MSEHFPDLFVHLLCFIGISWTTNQLFTFWVVPSIIWLRLRSLDLLILQLTPAHFI